MEEQEDQRESRGVHNPRVIDLITPDAASDEIVLELAARD